MLSRTPSHPVCILVAAPLSVLPLYAKEDDARAPLRCVARAHDMVQCLAEEDVAAVVYHEAPAADPDVLPALAAWYEKHRTHAPLLAVVTDLAQENDSAHPLRARSSLLFSRYHSRPQEVIALLRQWVYPAKKSKLKVQKSKRRSEA